MTTRVIFNIDKRVKEQAQRKARRQGLTLSSVLNLAAKAYANDRLEIEMLGELVAKAREEVRQGKTVSQEEVFKRLGL